MKSDQQAKERESKEKERRENEGEIKRRVTEGEEQRLYIDRGVKGRGIKTGKYGRKRDGQGRVCVNVTVWLPIGGNKEVLQNKMRSIALSSLELSLGLSLFMYQASWIRRLPFLLS